ncbi:MAG: hypothetical protein IPF78_11205 [Flavobacteriales bacterium]|nr:hypothetical protein [Flavobacteriales bacterium]
MVFPLASLAPSPAFSRTITSSLPNKVLTSNMPGPCMTGLEQPIERQHLADLLPVLVNLLIENLFKGVGVGPMTSRKFLQ